MTSPAWDNLNDFTSTDDFAVLVTITPQAGAVRYVHGIYDGPYLNAQIGEYDTDTISPRVNCKAADVAGLKRGDAVTVPGAGSFLMLSEPQPDGTGFALLSLSSQA